PFHIGAAAIAGWSAYLRGFARRGAQPVDIVDDTAALMNALTDRGRPAWAHPWPVVRQWPLALLRDCTITSPPGTETVPTLLLPPQAGTASCIVDHSPERSQVTALHAGGLTRVHCLDWLPATDDTDGDSIDEHLAVVAAAVAHLGGRVNLIGDSQGGWLATVYAALHPDSVHTLTVAGAPIDFHADRPGLDLLAHLPLGAGSALATLIYNTGHVFGLHLTDPVGEVQRAMTLLAELDDPDEIARITAGRRWFAWRQPMPSAFRDWIVEHLVVGNDLARGELVVDDRRVDLTAIDCPVTLLAGTGDLLAPPAQVHALARLVGTDPEQITAHTVDDGHIGLFIGRRVLTELWTPIASAVAAVPR
ncbi:MAG: alpha/beta fold hydrolase, partial [Rhodococcus sp. (in: high G+C Gram-positive bacteria)]|uniref:alpha/beta fold hydrolase n=1 Tax=Rhodococcus sp. TaxID=1831 RepID=UPI003BB5F159